MFFDFFTNPKQMIYKYFQINIICKYNWKNYIKLYTLWVNILILLSAHISLLIISVSNLRKCITIQKKYIILSFLSSLTWLLSFKFIAILFRNFNLNCWIFILMTRYWIKMIIIYKGLIETFDLWTKFNLT